MAARARVYDVASPKREKRREMGTGKPGQATEIEP